jgi:RNA polymerase sigma factor (sigma-70 family)
LEFDSAPASCLRSIFPPVNVVAANIDKELIQRCIKGDQVAWKDLVVRYERLVYSVALTFCPQSDDASDVFQQVWMELYQQLSDLRHTEALPAWLITVSRRIAHKVMNARRHSEPLDVDVPDPKQRLAQIEYEHALEQAVGRLGDRCRNLIALLYFSPDEPTYADIAQKLSMPVASIGPTRARCLQKLRDLLGT